MVIERLRLIGKQRSETARMMAEDKSLRQPGNEAGDRDLYMWPKPEETTEWQAADRITALSSEHDLLVEALDEARAALESVMNDEYDAFYVKVRSAVAKIDAALTGVTGGPANAHD